MEVDWTENCFMCVSTKTNLSLVDGQHFYQLSSPRDGAYIRFRFATSELNGTLLLVVEIFDPISQDIEKHPFPAIAELNDVFGILPPLHKNIFLTYLEAID
jgi:hypothetical protein